MTLALVKLSSDKDKEISFVPIHVEITRMMNLERTHYLNTYTFKTTLDRVNGSLDFIGLKFDMLIAGDEYGEVFITSYSADLAMMDVVLSLHTTKEYEL